jgi:hypothetical protein
LTCKLLIGFSANEVTAAVWPSSTRTHSPVLTLHSWICELRAVKMYLQCEMRRHHSADLESRVNTGVTLEIRPPEILISAFLVGAAMSSSSSVFSMALSVSTDRSCDCRMRQGRQGRNEYQCKLIDAHAHLLAELGRELLHVHVSL